MSWLTEAVKRGKSLAQQDVINKQAHEEEERRAAEQSRREQEQLQLERERKRAPWLQEVNTLLESFNTKEMVELGYYFTPLVYGDVYGGRDHGSIDVRVDNSSDYGPVYYNQGYNFSVGKREKQLVKKKSILFKEVVDFTNIGILNCGFYWLRSDEQTIFFAVDDRYNQGITFHMRERLGDLQGTFQNPADFAAFLKNLLMNWVAEVERSVA